ncbi:AraC family transcriptional regulator [Paraburkholderia sp. BCC1885]|uniref:AraC family transcriptional regulator n=1 Tax=Paraburkholderia sp. BCC1885 TaxID=2562669 RepID=UPI0011829192|nr:AraC family transcriptional regulator [Paraburkholderia sp. BCC1885]
MRNRSNLPVDPLSDLLDVLQARCKLSGQLIAGGDWAHRFSNLDSIKFNAATEGACWYFIDGMTGPALFESGDVLITNGTRSLILASTPTLITSATATPIAQDDEGRYRLGQAGGFAMLSGLVQVDTDWQALILNGLPPFIHIGRTMQAASPIASSLLQLIEEMKPGNRPGRSVVIAGLAQVLFVQTLRAYLAHAPQGDEGWLKGFGDHRLAVALSSIHGEPARNWNLDELAKAAGMSRTSFAVRFRDMMGVPPLTYLTRWRMHLARREIRAGVSVLEAAAKVGYASESAFRNAFRRVTEMTPGQYRQIVQRAVVELSEPRDVDPT